MHMRWQINKDLRDDFQTVDSGHLTKRNVGTEPKSNLSYVMM